MKRLIVEHLLDLGRKARATHEADTGLIHLYLGKEPNRDTKTACGKKLEDLPRKDSSVPFARRDKVTCPACAKKAEQIARMRGSF